MLRIKFDIFEDFVSPVTAAQTLLHSACKKRSGLAIWIWLIFLLSQERDAPEDDELAAVHHPDAWNYPEPEGW